MDEWITKLHWLFLQIAIKKFTCTTIMKLDDIDIDLVLKPNWSNFQFCFWLTIFSIYRIQTKSNTRYIVINFCYLNIFTFKMSSVVFLKHSLYTDCTADNFTWINDNNVCKIVAAQRINSTSGRNQFQVNEYI